MLRLALRTPGQRLIWTDELDRAAWDQALGSPPQSFTIHTLERLRRVIPARVNVRLLIGADQASTFHKWKSFRRVLRLAEPVVLPRGAITDVDALFASLDNSAWTAREKAAWCTRMAPAPAITISSTAIRRALARSPRTPKSWARHDVLRHIDPAVARYIVTQRLYSND